MTPQDWADFIGAMEHTPPSGVPSTGERLLLALALCEPRWLPAMYRDDDHHRRAGSGWTKRSGKGCFSGPSVPERDRRTEVIRDFPGLRQWLPQAVFKRRRGGRCCGRRALPAP